MNEEGTSGEVPDTPVPPADAPVVDPETFHRAITAGEPVRLLDVRNRDEVEAWRIDGPGVTFTHVPLSRFLQAQVTDSVADLAADVEGEGPITAVCAEGEASDYVAGLLVDAGFEARNLADGMAGWARVYDATEIATEPAIVQYHRPSSGCLAYMIVDGDEAIVVDPLRAFTERYRSDAADHDADIVAVVDTHLHADHVSGLRDLADATDGSRHMPAESVARGVTYDVEPLADGDSIHVGGTTVRAVPLPGHTTGMTGLAVGDVLLTGDSLFLDGVARPDLQVAEPDDQTDLARELHATIVERLGDVGDDIVVAPGHVSESAPGGPEEGFTATLGTLRERLPVFEMARSAFVDRILENLPPAPANAAEIVAINMGAKTADAEAAFELELGPNNCAAGTFAD